MSRWGWAIGLACLLASAWILPPSVALAGGHAQVPWPAPQGPVVPVERRVDAGVYLDDRSDAVAVVSYYVNALNRHEYLRAYSYWEPEAAATALGPFELFAQGFADTRSAELQVGPVGDDVGAGQLYYALPVALTAESTAGRTQTFVGCY